MTECCLKNKVQEYRLSANLTQVELAKAVNVTRQTIISLEKEDCIPSVLLALRLSRVLQVKMEKLFFEV